MMELRNMPRIAAYMQTSESGFILMCCEESIIHAANPAAKQIFGDDCVGKTLSQFIVDGQGHPHDEAIHPTHAGKAAKDGIVKGIDKDGNECALKVWDRTVYEFDGEWLMAGFVRRVNERK